MERSALNASNQTATDGMFNELFDYASFMWDNDIQYGTIQPNRWRDLGFSDMDLLAQATGHVSSQPILSWHTTRRFH